MNFDVGFPYRLTKDLDQDGYMFPAGSAPLILIHAGELVLYFAASVVVDDKTVSASIAIPRYVGETVLEKMDRPALIPFNPDPSTWYGKKIRLLRDVPSFTGGVITAGTPGLEVLDFKDKDLIIGFRTSTRLVGGELGEDGIPLGTTQFNPNPIALARVPVSLLWLADEAVVTEDKK